MPIAAAGESRSGGGVRSAWRREPFEPWRASGLGACGVGAVFGFSKSFGQGRAAR